MTFRYASLVVLAFAAAFCGKHRPDSEIASSAGFASYGLFYPEKVEELTIQYVEEYDEVRENISLIPSLLDKLENPDWKIVRTLVERADEAGRSRAFAEQSQLRQVVEKFYLDGKDETLRRVVNASETALKNKGCQCQVEFYPRVAFAYKDVIKKRLDSLSGGLPGTHRLVETHRGVLGKKNADSLSTYSSAIAKTSYIVFVSLPDLWSHIDRLVGEEDSVARTLEDTLEKEKQILRDNTLPRAEMKAADQRIKELEEVLLRVDEVVAGARRVLTEGEAEIKEIRREYNQVFDDLLEGLAERQTASEESGF